MSKTTTNLQVAMAGGYIGEVHLRPTILANSMRLLRGQHLLKPTTLYYYGERNERLNKKFGYPQEMKNDSTRD